MMIAARMAVATSFEVLMPRPTWPSESPITTMALKRVRWPARVCFWTGLICEEGVVSQDVCEAICSAGAFKRIALH